MLLAVDSGGSKCDALLTRLDGTVAGWGRCDFRDPESGRGVGGSGRTHRNVAAAVSRALSACRHAEVLHLVGLRALPGEWLPNGFRPTTVPHWVREHDPAFALAGEEFGLVALAGTGAFVYGRTADGREAFLDALGPLLGDYGGGYRIGHAAIRAAACADWHPRRATALAQPVREACRAFCARSDHFSLVEYMLGNPDRAEVASLARLVDEAARQGDAVAERILRSEAAALAETVHDVVDRLGVASEDLGLIAHGSVAKGSAIYWACLCDHVHAFAPRLRPIVTDLPAVAGAALVVLRQLAAADCATLRRNLAAGLSKSPA